MLSIENPPPDPPCPQLNSSDEQASPNISNKLPLQEVDLHNQPLDHHTPLPSFSIRDYVFTARSKDIKKNWPFTQQNLQLCLKHGVKDVLPPFQPLDTVRNQSFKAGTVETSSLEKQNIRNSSEEPPWQDNHVVADSPRDAQLNNKLAESCIDISSCRSGEENDFPSTTTSVSQSEIESVPDNRQSSSPLETETLLKGSVEVEAAGPPVTHKTENTSRPLGKKCRLIVKFGGNCDRNSTEDIASNCTTVSETMASKVCPVCKTFSSTSNTTLNAHMDQCLSVESTPKWTADSRLPRHRIKPRKTKFMVDIYATASHCTLEELDRRNGTSWATVSSLPTEETENIDPPNEGKKQRISPIHPEDAGDVGPVYIDANGTKVRILSKFNDPPPVTKVGDGIGARKSLKGGKMSKYVSKKKKKRLAQKHQKYLKLACQSKKVFSHKAHVSQICGVRENYNGEGDSCKKEHHMSKKINPNDSETLRPWVCSKPRGFTKKITSQEGHPPVRCKWHLPRNLLVESDPSFPGDIVAERNHVQKFTHLSENLTTSPENNPRVGKPFHKAQVRDKRERSPGRKRVAHHLVRGRTSDNVERSLPPGKQSPNQLSKDGTSIHDICMLRSPKSARNHLFLSSKKTADIPKDAINQSDISPIDSVKSVRNAHAIVSKAMRFSVFRKNVLSTGDQSPVPESRLSKMEKWPALKKSRVHLVREKDEEAVACHSEVDQQHALIHDHNKSQVEREEIIDNVPPGRSTVPEIRQELCISHGVEALNLKGTKSAPNSYHHDDGIKLDSSIRGCDDFVHKTDYLESAGKQVRVHGEDIVIEISSKAFDGTSTTNMSESVNTESYKLCNSLKGQSNSLRPHDDFRGLFCGDETSAGPTDPDFVNDQEMFSADEVGDRMIERNTDMRVELASVAGQGHSFPEVDPIPIPGPPGSFLPSPRDMGSEDFQGNSSLTTSRVQSSPDQHDVVDGYSSDSPISVASTISNSTASRSDFKYADPSSSVGPYVDQERIRSGLMAASFEPSLQNAGVVPQAMTIGVERTAFDGGYLKLDRISIEKGSLSFKNDQPCCCQRKERFSQSVALNHQESQLLRRRRMVSVTVPATGKQTGCNLNARPAILDVRPEPVPSSSCPTSGTEKVVLPASNPSADPIIFKDSSNSGARILARTDCDSASPSASNPVLRLMGKNLMVVNKDEDASVPLGQVQPCAQNNRQSSQLPTFSSFSPGNIRNHSYHSFHHMVPQGSVIFGLDQHNTMGQCLDVSLSKNFRSHSDMKMPHAPARLREGMFQDQRIDCGLTTLLEPHEYKGDRNFSSQQNRVSNRLNMSPTVNMRKNIATSDHQCKHMDSSVQPVKEIILIDDVPERETSLISDVAKYAEGWQEDQAVSSGIRIPIASNYNLSCVHPSSCYQLQDDPNLGEPPVPHNASFHATSTRLANTSPVRWGCTSEGSGVLQRSSFTAASASTGHLSSAALYYSPSFS